MSEAKEEQTMTKPTKDEREDGDLAVWQGVMDDIAASVRVLKESETFLLGQVLWESRNDLFDAGLLTRPMDLALARMFALLARQAKQLHADEEEWRRSVGMHPFVDDAAGGWFVPENEPPVDPGDRDHEDVVHWDEDTPTADD
jgi:hypothetical protein